VWLTWVTASPPHDFNVCMLPTRLSVHDAVVGISCPVTCTYRRIRDIRAPADVITTSTHRLSDVIERTLFSVSTLHVGARIYQQCTRITTRSKIFWPLLTREYKGGNVGDVFPHFFPRGDAFLTFLLKSKWKIAQSLSVYLLEYNISLSITVCNSILQ